MKRIVLIGAAMAGLFSAGTAAVASASTTSRSATHAKKVTVTVKKETKSVTAHLACKLALTTVPPAGSTAVTPGTSSGDQYGATDCTHVNSGVTHDAFTTDAAGDLTGTIQHWFNGGSIAGTFTLAQSTTSGPPTSTSFATSTFSGTVKITKSYGLLGHTTGAGTMKCTTTDGVHFACTENLKVTQKVTVLVKVK